MFFSETPKSRFFFGNSESAQIEDVASRAFSHCVANEKKWLKSSPNSNRLLEAHDLILSSQNRDSLVRLRDALNRSPWPVSGKLAGGRSSSETLSPRPCGAAGRPLLFARLHVRGSFATGDWSSCGSLSLLGKSGWRGLRAASHVRHERASCRATRGGASEVLLGGVARAKSMILSKGERNLT